ncbi:MAG: hypothetical protein CFH15_00979 [Alphaproteobacteria bacterium MarineAlpha5_Bin5]|nr:MAG: hypothetical protein CFH15_00979 [Alphaproteobacteria bacterium MarineAlpha5_Bin5]PPR51248.1 MAG: hypothetical protein CFH14_00760 [Alphaproteobacteria bacterium MarineAlpha5_Bin4]|tara:strand:+ start:2342 stop:2905 length:564 start_codon:yes stop_codon:yes gene_type:complete
MIIICSLHDLNSVCESINPKFLISVIDPGYAPETPKNVSKHLKLGFDDIIKISNENHIFRNNTDEIPQLPPNEDHISEIINFTHDWIPEEDIVIHCWCGVSRSMATATYLLCRENPSKIDQNIKYLRKIAPHANPNKLMIKYFEKELNLGDKITQAFNNYPYTITYDCSSNFAPVTLFNVDEMRNFK